MLEDTAHRLFLNALRNVRAIEHEGLVLLGHQLRRLERLPEQLAGLRSHHRETEEQIRRLDEIFASLEEDPSTLKQAAGALMGSLAGLTHKLADDEVLKNHIALTAFESLEIASYLGLIALARASEFNACVPHLQANLAEERAMAAWLHARVPEITRNVLARAAFDQSARA
jgi:ferritin-like metal-binding protein YciE